MRRTGNHGPPLRRIALAGALLSAGSAGAGPWSLPAGGGYVKLNYQYQYSDQQFDGTGRRRAYDFGGENEAHFAILEVAYGLGGGWQASVTVPVGLDVQFRQPSGNARGHGVGEAWILVARQLDGGAWVNAIETGFKIPLQDGSGRGGLNRITLTQGQLDWLVRWHSGWSLWPAPTYVQAELGYLVRAADRDPRAEFRPGDEIWFRVEGGYRPWSDVSVGLSADGIEGTSGTLVLTATKLAESARRVTRISPFAQIELGSGAEAEIRYYRLLRGGNFPAGDTWSISLFLDF